jgi:hypothetical protein
MFALLALFSSIDASASPSARLIYGHGPGAESCPDEAVLRAAVSSRIGYDPFFPYAPRTVVLTMGGSDAKLTARIELIENQQATARELSTSGTCGELLESAALAIAIAIDPRAWISPQPRTEAKPAPAEPVRPVVEPPVMQPVLEAPRAEERPRSAPSHREHARFQMALGPRMATGLQPSAAVGLGLGGALVWDRVSIGVEAESYLPNTERAVSGAEVRGWLVDGALVPCLRWLPLSVCGVARVGRFEGAGERVQHPTTDGALFLGVGGRVGAEVAVSDAVSAQVTGDVVGDLARPVLKVGSESVWRAPLVAAVFGISASYRF